MTNNINVSYFFPPTVQCMHMRSAIIFYVSVLDGDKRLLKECLRRSNGLLEYCLDGDTKKLCHSSPFYTHPLGRAYILLLSGGGVGFANTDGERDMENIILNNIIYNIYNNIIRKS